MKLELKNERHNPHLKRKELRIEINHENEATPRKAALLEMIAKQFGYNIENTDVRGIYTEGGVAKSYAKVFVWSEKKVAAGGKKEETATAEAKGEEAKTEENSETA